MVSTASPSGHGALTQYQDLKGHLAPFHLHEKQSNLVPANVTAQVKLRVNAGVPQQVIALIAADLKRAQSAFVPRLQSLEAQQSLSDMQYGSAWINKSSISIAPFTADSRAPDTDSASDASSVSSITTSDGESSSVKAPGGLKQVASADGEGLLQPCADPRATMTTVLKALAQANAAQRAELDWQAQNTALLNARRLLRHHPEVAAGQAMALISAVTPAVDALRSQTALNAMVLLQDAVQTLGPAAHAGADTMVAAVAKRAGEVSTAGRSSPLSLAADHTLATIVACLSEQKVVAALLGCATHKNANIRAKVAAHLDACVQRDPQKITDVPATMNRLLSVAAGYLEEGMADTRMHGKGILCGLAQTVPGMQLAAVLDKCVAKASLRRKVDEVIGQAASAPASPVRAQSALGRLSRGDSQPASPRTPPQTDTRGSIFAAHRALSGRTSSAAARIDAPDSAFPLTTQRRSSDAPGLPRAQSTIGTGHSSVRSSGVSGQQSGVIVGVAARAQRHSKGSTIGGMGVLLPAKSSGAELGRTVSARRRTSSANSVGVMSK
ncbi:probable TOG array regulator of axonemal microtubules protein 1 [Coccomyxa sp. Obi]|nr:probable TOG array regulator of axonemal microtubules protein 1 [Coccomyxa sp. Obi]